MIGPREPRPTAAEGGPHERAARAVYDRAAARDREG